jgi:hypothetical protein
MRVAANIITCDRGRRCALLGVLRLGLVLLEVLAVVLTIGVRKVLQARGL